jgi:hypothetical protein
MHEGQEMATAVLLEPKGKKNQVSCNFSQFKWSKNIVLILLEPKGKKNQVPLIDLKSLSTCK